ncbi:GldL-related protein [Portibacter lacus]|uniref:Gliding motility protein GldL n=1 Tax=Portibacter lacus TaxID=1099794 RepID=A0AA37SRB4_9BACT|nr:gliding motility protein GldL [Portibacter lacus]GLR19238.1 gliding motility protein GldL [Portibacter lacus]
MSFLKSKGFKYFKNLIIGLGAAAVMMGALGKINSEPWGGTMITVGLVTEAILFAFLGIIGPEKDYYWEKLYPGLDNYNANLSPLAAGGGSSVESFKPLDGESVDNKLGGMLDELQSMSKSLGALKSLQEVDFSETSEQLKSMHNFYSRMNEAMATLNDTVEDTKMYKEQMVSLNRNLTSLNSVYGNVLSAFSAPAARS